MQKRRYLALSVSTVLALALALMASALAAAGGRPLSAAPLEGENEAPVIGDLDGTGTFSATFNPGTGEVCYSFSVSGVEPLTAAHIHLAPPGDPGPVVIPTPITSPTGGSGCVTADRELILAIMHDPGAYYFNVHNVPFPGGALRAQLSKG